MILDSEIFFVALFRLIAIWSEFMDELYIFAETWSVPLINELYVLCMLIFAYGRMRRTHYRFAVNRIEISSWIKVQG